MKNVCIIGAGQLGSRHLQALKSVNESLNVTVIDPSLESLNTARERYESITVNDKNDIIYSQTFESITRPIDLAIIPTGSSVRKEVLLKLFEKTVVKYIILEKMLFQREEDLQEVELLIKEKDVKAWVNCPMRMMPFYQEVKNEFKSAPVFYQLSGSNFGLVTNLIHYLDYMVYLTGCDEFTLDTGGLEKTIVQSKRAGYMELNGTIRADFKDGSIAEVSCFNNGSLPLFAQIYDNKKRILINEPAQKAFLISKENGADLKEVPIRIPYQSEMTTTLVNQILDTGKCDLPTYHSSARTHRQIMLDLIPFINKYTEFKDKIFPFT